MGVRDRHVGKSVMDKATYNKYLGRAPFEPTAEDKTNFFDTSKAGEELSEPTAKRSRGVPFSQKIGNHFQEQWPYWAVGAGLFLLTTFAFVLAVNLRGVDVETQGNTKGIEEIRTLPR